jgi:hypothetical protein
MKYDCINTPKTHSRNLFSAWILSALLVLGTACTDFLDVPTTSDVSIPATADDYRNMLYPFYLTYTANPIMAVMGDDVYWSKDFYNDQAQDETFRRAYLWKDEVYDLSYNSTHWNNQYNMIYTYNKIIDEVRHVQGESLNNLLAIEAEARIYRALNYFYLVNTFAKPYAMASETDPGIPVILKNDVDEKNRQRTPVREVYEFILADLDSALKYIPDFAPNASRHQASKIGALGLKARTLFQMNRYNEVLTTLEDLLSVLEHKTSPNHYVYALFDYNNAGNKWMLPSEYDPAGNIEAVMLNGYMYDPTKGYAYGKMNAVLVSDHALALFAPGDIRKSLMLSTVGFSTSEPDKILKEGYYSNTGVSMPDVYLMLAECYLRNNNQSQALHYLNELRKKRNTLDNYADLASSDANRILRWILEERMREFIGTGHRWLDMRRLWDDPVGGTLINKIRMFDGNAYTLTKERLTVRIPEYIMQFHTDWMQNP